MVKQDPDGPFAQDGPRKVPIAPLNQQAKIRLGASIHGGGGLNAEDESDELARLHGVRRAEDAAAAARAADARAAQDKDNAAADKGDDQGKAS